MKINASNYERRLSFKMRLRLLFIASSILPLITIWAINVYQFYSMSQKNTNIILESELLQMKDNMDVLMDSMRYMSQQILNDENTISWLREYFSAESGIQRVNSVNNLREQIAVYEVSNPNINNITYLYYDEESVQKINVTSLARADMPAEEYMLSVQNKITFYGPHQTLSKVSEYPVLSLVRRIEVPGAPSLYLYIESGFKKMNRFAAQTLDELGAVYVVISESGHVNYSSDEGLIPLLSQVPAENCSKVRIQGRCFLPYEVAAAEGWRLQVYVPADAYASHLYALNLSFVLMMLLATAISMALAGIIGNSVTRPFDLFENNLNRIMTDDINANIATIHVKEFDQTFEYFSNMKERIISLVREAQRQEREKAELEAKQLLGKINPHFIHNTLNTLKWYASQQGYEDVEFFVSSLNRLLMYNMERDQVTTLQSELNAIRDYISLQKLKYNLNYTEQIDLPEPMLQTELPRFVLQPLVENAILHGVGGEGNVGIRVQLLPSGKISIRVVNDGFPLDMGRIEHILNSPRDLSRDGIGIQYVAQVLKARFHGAYEFKARVEKEENCFELILPYSRGNYYAKDFTG